MEEYESQSSYCMINRMMILSVRIATMGVKYLVSLLAFYFLSSADYVDFGIILASVNLFVLVVGVDVYQVTQRLHVTADKRKSTDLFVSELLLGSVCLLILAAVYYLLFQPADSRLPFLTLIILGDFIILTASRLVLVKGNALAASVVTALRVLPLMVVCGYLLVAQKFASLASIVYLWAGGSIIIGLATLAFVFRKLLVLDRNIKLVIRNLNFRVSTLFWLSSVSSYFLLVLDKLFVKHVSTDSSFSASYVFFTSLFSILPAFVDAGIVIPNFKEVVVGASYNHYRKLYRHAIWWCLGLASMVLAGIWVAHAAGLMHQQLYFLAIVIPIIGNSFMALNYIPGLFLYAQKADKLFFRAHFHQLLFIGIFGTVAFFAQSVELFLFSYGVCFALLFFLKLKGAENLYAFNRSV